MRLSMTRRSMLAGSASLLTLGGTMPAIAQNKTKLKFSGAFTENDLRGQAYKEFAAAIKDEFDFEPYWGNTLFKQGAELVALQRDNLDLCNLAPADISEQICPVAADLGLPVPRRGAHDEGLQERRRQRIHQDGQGSAWHPDIYAGLFRLA